MKKRINKYSRIGEFELQVIYRMQSEGLRVRAIAESVKRSPGTVSKVLNKYQHPNRRTWGAFSWVEKASHVYQRMQVKKKRSWHGKCVRDEQTANYIIQRLEAGDSPEIISAVIKSEINKFVSVKTIYNFVKQRRGLKKYLAEKGKRRRQNVRNPERRWHKKAAPTKRCLEEKSEEANQRSELGHLEGDLVVSGKHGKAVVMSLIDRRSRTRWYIKLPNRKSETVLAYLRAFIINNFGYVRTITFDNGSEFAYSALIKLETAPYNIKIYYCDACCPWQKGSNENCNRALRRFFPKGTNFDLISKKELLIAQNYLNNRRMKCLGFVSPNAFQQLEASKHALVA